MSRGNHFCNFITLDTSNPPVSSGKEKFKLDFSLINKLPVPVSVWQKIDNSFYLIYVNQFADKIFKSSLHWGIRLDKAFPVEYQNILSTKPAEDSFFQLIDDEILLICHYLDDSGTRKDLATPKDPGNETLKSIIEPSPVSVMITDVKGNIEYVNAKFLEVSGYSVDEVMGKNPRILKSGNTSPEQYKCIWETLMSGNIWRGEFINKRKNGDIYHEFAVISPIKDKSGRIRNFIAFKEDITELKNALNEMNKAEKFAALGKMAAFVSHQIKTPLSSIKLSIDLLGENDSIDDEARRSISIIQKEVGNLSKLLKDVLQFSKETKLYFSEIDLTKKLEVIHTLLQPMMKARGIKFKTNTAGHSVYGDTQQLHSLFLHMLENSIDSIDANGEIEIYSEMKNGACRIFIKDSGHGIEDTRFIFEPFYTTKTTGAGFGLPIAKNIAQKHNGQLNLFSTKPGETIFELVLPAKGA